MEFIRHQPDRDGSWKAWLVTIEVEGSRDEFTREPADPRDVVAVRSELRFALDVFATVPER